MKSFCVVLVRPRNPNNIGACARALGNFGLSDLRIVDPYPPVWQEAVSAVGVDDILKNARVFSTLAESLSDVQFSFAATALQHREIKQKAVALPCLGEYLTENTLTAFVFGNEKSGLSSEDIERCDYLLHIPTSVKQPSVNLAQAVILTCYELSRSADFKPARQLPQSEKLPTDGQKEIFITSVDSLLEKTGYYTHLSSHQRKNLLRKILSKQGVDTQQLFFLKKWVEKMSALLDK